MSNADNQVIITVSGTDKIGIVAGVSNKLLQYNVNIEDISQTVLGDYFTMIMLVSLDSASIKFADLVKKAEILGKESGVEIHVQNEEIFNAIHKI